NPRARDVARAVADETDRLFFKPAELFANRKKIGENLARVLVVGERVDRRDAGILRELDDIALRECADDRAVEHPAHDARGVPDRLAASELNVGCVEK